MKPSTTVRTPRTYITAFLVALGLLALFYNIFATFPSLTNTLKGPLEHVLSQKDYCSKDIGEGMCCDLFLAADPCVEQCREDHVDRETFSLTEEFEMCAEQCLAGYTQQCVDVAKEKLSP